MKNTSWIAVLCLGAFACAPSNNVETSNQTVVTGELGQGRVLHTLTVIDGGPEDGHVIAAGGGGPLGTTDSVERYDPSNGTWYSKSSMAVARKAHTATSLGNGQILVAGGTGTGGYRDSVERHTVSSDDWTIEGSLAVARAYHTATRLTDGRVLIVGGFHVPPGGTVGEPTSNVEVYDPASKQSVLIASTANAHVHHTATRLTDGRVLILGNAATAEIYDPTAATWSQLPGLNTPRSLHTATLMDDGTVIVVGGVTSEFLSSTERYDPASGTSQFLADTPTLLAGHSATRTAASVVVIGGYAPIEGTLDYDRFDGVYEYDAAADSWTAQTPLAVGRNDHRAVALGDQILVAGGASNGSEFYTRTTELLTIEGIPAGSAVNPWQGFVTSQGLGATATDIAWNYTMGYHFKPLTDGEVSQLGGFFNGTKEVRLWDRATGALLASTSVTAANDWSYTDITPVPVSSGSQYTVAVRLARSGGSYLSGANLPVENGNIQIEASTYVYSGSNPDARPTNAVLWSMYGQADIGFAGGALPPDTAPPSVSWVAPASGAEVSGSVTLVASATDNRGVSHVEFSLAGTVIGTATAAPYQISWDTTTVPDGFTVVHVHAYDDAGNKSGPKPRPLTVLNAAPPGQALFSASYGTPLCDSVGATCDTGALVDGRRTLGPEPNYPNTLDGCADGGSGSYHSDESIDRIRVTSVDGGNLKRGALAQVEVTVYAWSATSDWLDLYVDSDAAAPGAWVHVGTYSPSGAGIQTIAASVTLPAGTSAKQAIRAQFRYNGNSTSTCSAGGFNDRDDLVFTTE